MGNTFRGLAGGVDALEGVFGGGRASEVCRPNSRWRTDERCVPVFRDIPKDRLQNLQSVQGERAGGLERSLPAAGALCQPAAGADREPDRAVEAGEAALGA